MSDQTSVVALATAADVMRPPVTTVEQQGHVAAAAYLMKHAGATALLVLDAWTDQPVIKTTTIIRDAANLMTSGRFRHLPVVGDADLVGIIDITDVCRALLEPGVPGTVAGHSM
jgi:CBS domain-containing protein